MTVLELQQNRKSADRVNYSHAFTEKKLKEIEKELANTKQELDDANNRYAFEFVYDKELVSSVFRYYTFLPRIFLHKY